MPKAKVETEEKTEEKKTKKPTKKEQAEKLAKLKEYKFMYKGLEKWLATQDNNPGDRYVSNNWWRLQNNQVR